MRTVPSQRFPLWQPRCSSPFLRLEDRITGLRAWCCLCEPGPPIALSCSVPHTLQKCQVCDLRTHVHGTPFFHTAPPFFQDAWLPSYSCCYISRECALRCIMRMYNVKLFFKCWVRLL